MCGIFIGDNMSKSTKIAAALGIGTAALITEFVIHGYLDIMYKETIPPSLPKYLSAKKSGDATDEFASYTAEQCECLSRQNVEVITRKSQNGYNLKGYLLTAENKTNKFVLFAHGYRSDHLGDPANFEKYYYEQGYNFMSVDHTSAGDSEGDWVGFDYYESQDMLAWIDYLVERFGEDIQIILHGVSMGGATVCQMASSVQPQVKLIISDCAYTSANDQFTKVANSIGIKRLAPVAVSIVNALNKRLAGYDLALTDVRESVKNSRVPMLFVHGLVDDFVPVEMCYELYEICGSEKDMLIIDKASHAQSIMVDGDTYKAKIEEFINRFM